MNAFVYAKKKGVCQNKKNFFEKLISEITLSIVRINLSQKN